MAAMMLLARPPAPSSFSTSISFPGGATRTVGIDTRSLSCSEHQLWVLGKPTPLRCQLTSSSSSYHARGRWEKKPVPVEGRPLVPSLPTPRSLPRRICHCTGTSAEGESGGSSEDGGSLIRGAIVRAGEVLSMCFPLWVASACVLALLRPSSFLWVPTKWQIIGLTITMLGMGMTLTLDDLRSALLMPRNLLVGFLLQYTVRSLAALPFLFLY
ncbi:hypothetical protein Taro_031701, partial [Colocasia esculenta]|nr:hypothetical protein [Colocasia esculenta]